MKTFSLVRTFGQIRDYALRTFAGTLVTPSGPAHSITGALSVRPRLVGDISVRPRLDGALSVRPRLIGTIRILPES
jgi:hypothetical protein